MTSRDHEPTATMPATGTQPFSGTREIWLDGQWVDPSKAVVSVFDHGLLYGDGCFEGIRIYNGRIFKLRTHLERIYDSAQRIRLEPAYDIETIEAATREAVRRNGLTDGYIRIVFTRGSGTLGLHPFKCPRPSAFIIAADITLYPEEMYVEGMPVIVAKRPRIPIDCLDPKIKSLNYLNNILAKVEAIDAGVLEAIMLNIDGDVAECTGDNIFVVKDGRISSAGSGGGHASWHHPAFRDRRTRSVVGLRHRGTFASNRGSEGGRRGLPDGNRRRGDRRLVHRRQTGRQRQGWSDHHQTGRGVPSTDARERLRRLK